MGKSDEEEGLKERHSLHQHPLRYQKAEGPYKCNGCKQPGFTTCFKCPQDICDFHLHEDCFRAEKNTYTTHKYMQACRFDYHASPPRVKNRYCDACGLDILGFRYECSEHKDNPHDLHPTCAYIDPKMDWDGLELTLRDKVKSKCFHCDERYPAEACKGFTGWKWVAKERYYRFPFCFSGKKICYHVKCLNEIMAPKEEEFDEFEMYHICSPE